jgi:hypothetical protein
VTRARAESGAIGSRTGRISPRAHTESRNSDCESASRRRGALRDPSSRRTNAPRSSSTQKHQLRQSTDGHRLRRGRIQKRSLARGPPGGCPDHVERLNERIATRIGGQLSL